VGYAFAYTFIVNKTGSVLLAIAMQASFNVANGFAGLRTEEALRENDYLLILGLSAATIWALVAVLVAVTHGRLGSGAPAAADRPSKPAARRRVVPA
jgi:hypothetical protein